jgi:hypothetical protein
LIGTKLMRTTADHSWTHTASTSTCCPQPVDYVRPQPGDLIAHTPDVDGILVRFLMRTHGRRKMAVVIDALIEELDPAPGGSLTRPEDLGTRISLDRSKVLTAFGSLDRRKSAVALGCLWRQG